MIIISLKKLTKEERKAIKAHYSVIEFNSVIHKEKRIKTLGSCDVLLFQLDLGFLGHISNNEVYQYLIKVVDELFKPKILFIYNNEKHKKILGKLSKVVNFFLPKLPDIKKKNLLEILEQKPTNNKNKNNNINYMEKKKYKTIKKQKMNDTKHIKYDKDNLFEEFFKYINQLKSENKTLQIKTKELQKELETKVLETLRLKESVEELKCEIDDLQICLPHPVLERQDAVTAESEPEPEPQKEFKIVEKNNELVVISNITNEVVKTVTFRTKRKKMKKFKELSTTYST